ncbi:hypothetical protein DFH29DRAFT_919846 [Suillus ampliporus]|nr:hypothetical protein DFH29DRAFT_919846 [Suillus ampliporus]
MASATESQTAPAAAERILFPPLLSKEFNITDIKQDAVKWNKGWEAAIASSTAADVLEKISHFLDDSFFTPSDLEFLYTDLRRIQEGAAQGLRGLFDQGHFDTIWLLLDTSEQRRHILEGLEKASEAPTFWGQDCRALCPEVTVSNFLLQGGKGFFDFLTRFLEVFESSNPALLPNPWWEQASNDLEKQRSESTKVVFEVATISRNKFIDMQWMKTVLDIMENTKGYFAKSLAYAKTTLRDKPLIRCDNCTKTPEDIGQGVRFMVCSTCKAKLSFEVHYCSQSCQNEDWPVHKKACGKKKVSKGLSGTKGDSLWAFSDPVTDLFRNLPKKQGNMTLTDIGVGPCKGQRSPAAERQAKMLEANKDVDYFLFTASGAPVRFVINDFAAKMVFRIVRGMVMTQTTETGLEGMAEYMLKLMSGYPGLSREIILKQLCAEYGNDTTEKVAKWEQITRERGTGPLIESWSKDWSKMIGHVARMAVNVPKRHIFCVRDSEDSNAAFREHSSDPKRSI